MENENKAVGTARCENIDTLYINSKNVYKKALMACRLFLNGLVSEAAN